MRRALWAGIAGALVVAIVSSLRPTPYNNYVLFADALLHGRLWIDWPGSYIDAVAWHGHRFIINDPVPGLLLIPLVALVGTAANQTLLSVVLAGVAVGGAWRLCERYDLDPPTTAWLVAFFFVGTDLLWCAFLGDVWFLAQVSATAFLVLALLELQGKNRAWLVALWFVLAVGSRFTIVVATPVVAYLACAGPMLRVRRIAGFGTVYGLAAALWVGYNVARWGVPWDSGHTIFFHEDAIGSTIGSPFGLRNLAYQFQSFFVQGVTVLPQWPWLKPEYGGLALTWTSPALILALWANRPRATVVAMWAATLLVAAPSFLYYVNGFAQFGMRHALDFEPFLFVLMILAVRRLGGIPALGMVLIAWSALVGAWGVWFWRIFYRG
jgi:hypothetical protein